jgi:hypothetical protein
VAGRFEHAQQHLQAALAGHRRLGTRPWEALTWHAHAGMLRRRGRPGDGGKADVAAAAARTTAGGLGMRLPAT